MIFINLFPTQTEIDGLFVIIEHPIGITYKNQCGGNACDQKQCEGFMIPIGYSHQLQAIRSWFTKHYGESCHCDGRLALQTDKHIELCNLISELWFEVDGNITRVQLDLDSSLKGAKPGCL